MPGANLTPRRGELRQRVVALLGARLVLALTILAGALAVTTEHARGGLTASERGLYATVVAAFVGTILCAAVQGRIRRLGAFTAAQLLADVAIVSALVYFSGGSDSFFAFLYVPITVYAALLLGRRGAYLASGFGALGYGAALWLSSGGDLGARPGDPIGLAVWGTHAGALLVVALLASALSRERDRAGRALAQKTRDLASLQRLHQRTVESLTSGLLTTDPAGAITSFNPEAERITGWSAAEAIGRPLGDVIPGAAEIVLEAVRAGDRRAAERGRARLPHCNRRGQHLHLGLAGSVLRGGPDGPGGFVVIFQDVTRVVDMEIALRRHERLAGVGQLAADLAHEIRNPLAAISGSIQILEAGLTAAQSEESGRLMGIVVRETDRLNALITDFLHYARPAPAKPEVVILRSMLGDMEQLFESVRPPEIRLCVDVPPELRVLCDERQLRQCLWNLFLNAVQAMPGGGELAIRAAPAQAEDGDDRNGGAEGPQEVSIEVADTGTGIEAAVLERIFDPFFTTKEQGSGLGLATVHRIVEANGGQVIVESAPGRGTRFSVRLPGAEGVR